jgi:aconitate hydratase
MNSPAPSSRTETLLVGSERSEIFPLDAIPGVDPAKLSRRPRTIRILVENLWRNLDRTELGLDAVQALAVGGAGTPPEIPFFPSRVLLQDFTGVPVVVDLSAMRTAAPSHGKDPAKVNPLVPVDLVIDHSIQVDSYARPESASINLEREFERNGERYRLLRWAQQGFNHFRVVPPGNGICHQVNLEFLATVVDRRDLRGKTMAFPDTVVGTDSHTTMVNGLGVLGFGVGGIEAEAVMLGEPYSLPAPEVVGVRLSGTLPEGATATDLVLTVTRTLRAHGVVEKFVEFFGPGVAALAVPDRATITNMCPEYGATAALFPVDAATTAYLRGTGRDPALVARVEAYARRQGWWAEESSPDPVFDELVEIDLAAVVPTVSGPRNPEESVALGGAPGSFRNALGSYRREHPGKANGEGLVRDGSVVIAAITSCTNTSNPSVMIGAGLIAQKAKALGLKVPPYVKTSLAPGSKVVTSYLQRARLLEPLASLGFGLVGYGCTTCIGNSGPLPPEVAREVAAGDLFVAAVLSGNRNFEARIQNQVRANYLASPMLVVAYALAGRMDLDLTKEPLGRTPDGRPVMLSELWPSAAEVRTLVESSLDAQLFRDQYRSITQGDARWDSLSAPTGPSYDWVEDSTYLRLPPYFELPPTLVPNGPLLLEGARVLALLDDKVTTDHISPAGEIPADSPAGQYLLEHGVAPADLNTYGARRGHHEVMARATFANVRLKNRLAPGTEGGRTLHLPEETPSTIFAASERYRQEKVPLLVLAGASYGQGSSRDWAAKGPRLLGVDVVAAKSYERIHRSNLVGMGVLPLQFHPGEGWKELGLSGHESYELRIPPGETFRPRGELDLVAHAPNGAARAIRTKVRIDSAREMEYYRGGGLLPYVLGRLGSG